jgi:type IV pilus assembly protein PilO
MTLDELRHLDPKDIPNWPLAGQAIALGLMVLLVIALGYYFVLSDQMDQLNASKAQEESLKTTYLDKRRQVVNKAALEAQLKEIERSFGTLIKQLPTKSEMDSVLTEINQAGTGRGLQFELFRPGIELKSAEMAELPISIRLSGRYDQLAHFASDLGRLSRIVTLTDISLAPISDKDDRLMLQAVAKIYRALEPEEIAARAAGAKPAK